LICFILVLYQKLQPLLWMGLILALLRSNPAVSPDKVDLGIARRARLVVWQICASRDQ
jgi:hypothetical protein